MGTCAPRPGDIQPNDFTLTLSSRLRANVFRERPAGRALEMSKRSSCHRLMKRRALQAIHGDRLVFGGLLGLLLLAPLPFALARDWGEALLTGLSFLLLALWCGLAVLGQVQWRQHRWSWVLWPLLLLLLVQVWALIQTVPLPVHWVRAIDPDLVVLRPDLARMPLSLDPYYTLRYGLLGLALAALFFLAATTVRTPRRVRWLLRVLVFSGTCQAAYGTFMVLSGLEYGFFVEKYAGIGVATGTFVNRNHLAGYLNMCLAAGIGLLLAGLSEVQHVNWRARLRAWLELMLSSKIRLRLFLAVMVIGLVLTRSRMGNVAFFTGLILVGAATLMARQQFQGKVVVFFVSLLVVDLLILGQWFGLDALLARLEETQPVTEGRVAYAPFLWEYIRTFPWTGSGAGSFYGVFGQFHGGAITASPAHAHNDYAQFAAEYGIPILGLLGVFVLATGWQAWRLLRSSTRLYQAMGFAGGGMVVWLVLHSSADFNLQIAANAATVMAIAGGVWGCQAVRHQGRVQRRAAREE